MEPMMNSVKWNELRVAMGAMGDQQPVWRVKRVGSEHISDWEEEWLYHFRECDTEMIEWLEIQAISPEQDSKILAILQAIHVPGHRSESGFRIYGKANSAAALEYI